MTKVPFSPSFFALIMGLFLTLAGMNHLHHGSERLSNSLFIIAGFTGVFGLGLAIRSAEDWTMTSRWPFLKPISPRPAARPATASTNSQLNQRYTERARALFSLANEEAHRRRHPYIEPEHLLLALVNMQSGVAVKILREAAIDPQDIQTEVNKLLKDGDAIPSTTRLSPSPRARQIPTYAVEEARLLNHNFIGTEHVLLGLLRIDDGIVAQVLKTLDIDIDKVRDAVRRNV